MERGIVTVLFFFTTFPGVRWKEKKRAKLLVCMGTVDSLFFFLTIYQGQGWNSALSEAQTHFEPSMKTNVREMEGQ